MRTKLDGLSSEERKQLVERLYKQQEGKCYICGEPINLQVSEVDIDHIIALHLGGIDDENNYGLTHSSCNRSKGTKDLQLQKYLHQFHQHIKKYVGEGNEQDFTVKIALGEFAKARKDIGIHVDSNKVTLSYEEDGNQQTAELPILTDLNDKGTKSFIAQLPIDYVYHDESVNPRSIVDLEPMIEEFYNRNPQLQPSLALVEFSEPEGKSKIMLFDGQHKAAAQMYIGKRKLFLRVFINADKNKIKEVNFRAHTKLAQIHFPQLINDKVGHDIFEENFNSYLERDSLSKKSEKRFLRELPQQNQSEYRQYLRNYLKYGVLTGTSGGEKNKIMQYLETVSARSKRFPLSYETLQKTFLSYLYAKSAEEDLEETQERRNAEQNNLIKLLNIFVEEILSGKFDLEQGIFKIEDQIAKDPNSIKIDHLRAYRMCRATPMIIWTKEFRSAMETLLGVRMKYKRTEWQEERPLWADFDDQDWQNVRRMFQVVAQHKVWIEYSNSEIVQAISSTKQTDWREILLEGKLPGRAEKIYTPLDQNYLMKFVGSART